MPTETNQFISDLLEVAGDVDQMTSTLADMTRQSALRIREENSSRSIR